MRPCFGAERSAAPKSAAPRLIHPPGANRAANATTRSMVKCLDADRLLGADAIGSTQ
jgi:hypothetical protein